MGVFWTLGFTCKFLTILLGHSLYQVSTQKMFVYQACIVALSDFFAMVVPIYLVTDAYFIKVLQGRYLKTQEDPNESFLTLTDNENGLNAPLLNATQNSQQTFDLNLLLAS